MSEYTDFELVVATQIAYLDFDRSDISENPDWTVRDHLIHNADLAEAMKKGNPAAYDAVMNGSCQDWKIVHNVTNEDSGNGFAACLIETSSDKAIVGFRGSEALLQNDNLVKDWVEADIGLLNSTQTDQQRSAEGFIDYINKNYNYDSYELTGHSLGGNLAEHALITAPDDFAAKVDHVLSVDGPGFSDEYIKKNEERIAERSYKIDQYQCSLVGAMLNPLPGSNYQHMESKSLLKVLKHSTKNMTFDENGMMVLTDDVDGLSKLFYGLSNIADDITSATGIGGFMQFMLIVAILPAPAIGFLEAAIATIMEAFGKDAKEKYNSSEGKTEFKVETNALASSIECFSNVVTSLASYSDEIESINKEISVFIKMASLFTLSYKLRKSEANLEKLSKKTETVKAACDSIHNLFQSYENRISSNVG